MEERVSIRESRAVISLVLLIIITQFIIFFTTPIKRESDIGTAKELTKELTKEEATLDKSGERVVDTKSRKVQHLHSQRERDQEKSASLFPFDPNSVTVEELVTLGLSERQAGGVINYRRSGGKFYKREELAKIYTLPEGFYQKVENYIEIEIPVVELNSADSLQLIEVRGIGPYFARSIIELRDRCGGICNLEQLMMIRGMDSIKLASIAPYLSADTTLIDKREIATLSYDELSRNPYIGAYLARAILHFKERVSGGSFNLSTLITKGLINIELGSLLRHYFR